MCQPAATAAIGRDVIHCRAEGRTSPVVQNTVCELHIGDDASWAHVMFVSLIYSMCELLVDM